MNSERPIKKQQCSICGGRLKKQEGLIMCSKCNEYFIVGTKQFQFVFGTNKSFTAKDIPRLCIAPLDKATKFSSSISQLLKSDLNNLEVLLCCFRDEEMESLAYFISNHKLLKKLDIQFSNNKKLKIVVDAIENSKTIEEVIIRHDGSILTKKNAKLIGSMLKNNKSARRANVQFIKAHLEEPDNLEFINKGIFENTTIETLSIDSLLTKPIVLRDNLKSLTLTRSVPEFAEFLRDALKANKSIQKLVLLSTHLKVVSSLLYNTAIKELQVAALDINDDSFDRLSEVFKCHPSLSSVTIYIDKRLPLTPANIQSMCNGLQQSKSITKLHVDIDNQSEEAFLCFLNGVLLMKHLKELKIHRITSIGNPVDIAFTEALKDPNCTLKILDMNQMKFQSDNAISLALALAANKSLEVIDLERTHFPKEASKVVQRWLVTNTKLKSIRFGNIFGAPEDDGFDISEIIKCNTTLTKLNYCSSIKYNEDKIIDALTVNDTLTDLSVNCSKNFTKAVMDRLADTRINQSLRQMANLSDADSRRVFQNFTKPNREYQSLMISNTVVLIHNIARDSSAFNQLPREIWVLIFEQLRYPGTTNFKSAAVKIFKSYMANK